ncbi:hypothetical protein N657DRAFT_636078 [Parathielavia appendiculata]|uniref:Uncharacterized protein n=1 Tax=Parathielavia appendiculata TaxID=2587402 RepID=A0AAN6Z0L8_9PEZI|nr:hypothetical protein N657DRAFT_636078 [Parathielavia appendiculata]
MSSLSHTSVSAKLRTILVKVSPAPSSLSERRAILHLLKKYADVEYFKRLKDPSHFISIVNTPQTARRLIEQSPFVFDYRTQQQSGKTSSSLSAADNKPLTTNATNPPNGATSVRTFLVKVTEKFDYKHKTRIRSSILYGHWPQHDDIFQADSVAKAVLRRSVPEGLDLDGLADWESFGQADEDESNLAASLRDKRDFVKARGIRKANDASGFESLVELWNTKHGDKLGMIGEDGRKGAEGAAPVAAVGESMPGESSEESRARDRSDAEELDRKD